MTACSQRSSSSSIRGASREPQLDERSYARGYRAAVCLQSTASARPVRVPPRGSPLKSPAERTSPGLEKRLLFVPRPGFLQPTPPRPPASPHPSHRAASPVPRAPRGFFLLLLLLLPLTWQWTSKPPECVCVCLCVRVSVCCLLRGVQTFFFFILQARLYINRRVDRSRAVCLCTSATPPRKGLLAIESWICRD